MALGWQCGLDYTVLIPLVSLGTGLTVITKTNPFFSHPASDLSKLPTNHPPAQHVSLKPGGFT